MTALVDTSVLIDYLRGHQGAADRSGGDVGAIQRQTLPEDGV